MTTRDRILIFKKKKTKQIRNRIFFSNIEKLNVLTKPVYSLQPAESGARPGERRVSRLLAVSTGGGLSEKTN